MGTAGPQLRAPDLSGRYRTSTAQELSGTAGNSEERYIIFGNKQNASVENYRTLQSDKVANTNQKGDARKTLRSPVCFWLSTPCACPPDAFLEAGPWWLVSAMQVVQSAIYKGGCTGSTRYTALYFWCPQHPVPNGGQWFRQLKRDMRKLNFSFNTHHFEHREVWSSTGKYDKYFGLSAKHRPSSSGMTLPVTKLGKHGDEYPCISFWISLEETVKSSGMLFMAHCVSQSSCTASGFGQLHESHRAWGWFQHCMLCSYAGKIFCGTQEIPGWDHLMWYCKAFSSGRPVVDVDASSARRLGWPQAHTSAMVGGEILTYIVSITVSSTKGPGWGWVFQETFSLAKTTRTAGLQPRAPDLSGHCWTSRSARCQWALLHLNGARCQIECRKECQIEC